MNEKFPWSIVEKKSLYRLLLKLKTGEDENQSSESSKNYFRVLEGASLICYEKTYGWEID